MLICYVFMEFSRDMWFFLGKYANSHYPRLYFFSNSSTIFWGLFYTLKMVIPLSWEDLLLVINVKNKTFSKK